jgi:hypothetical protein
MAKVFLGLTEVSRSCHQCGAAVDIQVDLQDQGNKVQICLSYGCKGCGAEQIEYTEMSF